MSGNSAQTASWTFTMFGLTPASTVLPLVQSPPIVKGSSVER